MTAYILLVLCAPVINSFISCLSRRGCAAFLLLSWAFLYSSNYVLGSAYINLVRAFFFYVLGAFVRLHLDSKLAKRTAVLLAFLCAALWLGMAASAMGRSRFAGGVRGGLDDAMLVRSAVMDRLLAAAGPCVCVPAFSFCLFLLFASLDMACVPCVNALASAVFGVYLLHDSTFGRLYIWNHALDVGGSQYGSRFFPLVAALDILAVFCACAAFDLLRQKWIAPRLKPLEESFARAVGNLLFARGG